MTRYRPHLSSRSLTIAMSTSWRRRRKGRARGRLSGHVGPCRCRSRGVQPALDLLRLLLEVGAVSDLFKKLHQDGSKAFYTIAADAAMLYPEGVPCCAALANASWSALVRSVACGKGRPAWNMPPIMDAMCDRIIHGASATIRIAIAKARCGASSPRNILGCSHG